MYKSFTYVVKFIPKYFVVFFDAIIAFLSDNLLLVYINTAFCIINLHPGNLLDYLLGQQHF